LNPIRVLIADDEEDFLESLTKVLGRRGIAVEKAADGRIALDILARQQFDVIVLDLRMPVLDGLDTLKQIRQTDGLTPVILLSGHADLAFVTEALKGGAADYMLKPCPVETLVAALETASERKAIACEVAEKVKK